MDSKNLSFHPCHRNCSLCSARPRWLRPHHGRRLEWQRGVVQTIDVLAWRAGWMSDAQMLHRYEQRAQFAAYDASDCSTSVGESDTESEWSI